MGQDGNGKRKDVRDMQALATRKDERADAGAAHGGVQASTTLDTPASAVLLRAMAGSGSEGGDSAAAVAGSRYIPRGRTRLLIETMQAEPARTWTSFELAALIKVRPNEVSAYTLNALKNAVIFRGKRDGVVLFGVQPFPLEERITGKRVAVTPPPMPIPPMWKPEGDVRIPQVVPGWRPPRMVAPREGT